MPCWRHRNCLHVKVGLHRCRVLKLIVYIEGKQLDAFNEDESLYDTLLKDVRRLIVETADDPDQDPEADATFKSYKQLRRDNQTVRSKRLKLTFQFVRTRPAFEVLEFNPNPGRMRAQVGGAAAVVGSIPVSPATLCVWASLLPAAIKGRSSNGKGKGKQQPQTKMEDSVVGDDDDDDEEEEEERSSEASALFQSRYLDQHFGGAACSQGGGEGGGALDHQLGRGGGGGADNLFARAAAAAANRTEEEELQLAIALSLSSKDNDNNSNNYNYNTEGSESSSLSRGGGKRKAKRPKSASGASGEGESAVEVISLEEDSP